VGPSGRFALYIFARCASYVGGIEYWADLVAGLWPRYTGQ
jgi:hypothetical protein